MRDDRRYVVCTWYGNLSTGVEEVIYFNTKEKAIKCYEETIKNENAIAHQ